MNNRFTVDLPSEYIDLLKSEIQNLLPNSRVVVFGSRVRGNAKKYSDVDLAIIDVNKIPIKTLHKIKANIDPQIDYLLDIVDYDSLSKDFQVIIDRTGIEI